MANIKIGLVGIGKIARDQHIPVIAANPDFRLIACAGHGAAVEGVASFASLDAMLQAVPEIDAVVVATPTTNHYISARTALMAGKHVLLEKPPCRTTAELNRLVHLTARHKRTLFASWHLRYAPRVEAARNWLKARTILGGRIVWKEHAEDTHPGQTWIWQPGGFGVFDPGINAVSVLTDILTEPVFVESAELFFATGADCPRAAEIVLRTESGAPVQVSLDFDFHGKPTWDIALDTDQGTLTLADAATHLQLDGTSQGEQVTTDGMHAEYTALYRHFAGLIANGACDVDAAPLRLVADIFLVARHSVLD